MKPIRLEIVTKVVTFSYEVNMESIKGSNDYAKNGVSSFL